jgi:signal transduction histidine kinase
MSTTDVSRFATVSTGVTGQPAPLPHWHASERSGHVVQFYSDDSFLIESLSRFVGAALVAGDSAIIIATPEHRNGLAHRLSERALNLGKAAREGRYITLDANEALSRFMHNGLPDRDAFAATIGAEVGRAAASALRRNARVVAFGEMVALLFAEGRPDAAIKLEQLWNDLARQHAFSLRCAYPITTFRDATHAAPFLRICSEHSAVIPGESYTSLSSDQDRLRNIAELQQKAEALETETALLHALRETKEALEREVAERREAERKLLHSELSLRELSGHLIRTQDQERRRLGRELHDTIGQYLAVLKMGLDSLNSRGVVPGHLAANQIADCLSLAEQSIKELRTMSYLLYPPMLEEMGLKTAIQWYIEGFAKRSGIAVQFDISPHLRRLPEEIELTAFRVLQECLTNVHRHSGSPTARIRVSLENGFLSLEISDRGKGVPASVSESPSDAMGTLGVGLRGMNERVRQLGGTLSIISDSGTTVRASLPLELESPNS